MLNKFFTALVLITATTSSFAFPGPSGSFNQSGAHGGNIQGTRTTTVNSGQFEGSVTGPKGKGISAESAAQQKGNTTNYTGTATTTGGKSVTATGSVKQTKTGVSGTNETTTAGGYSAKSSYEVNKDSETGAVSGSATATTGAGYTATVTGSGTQTGGSVTATTGSGQSKTVSYGDQKN